MMGYITSPISLEKNNISHAFMLKCSCSLDHPLFSFPCEVRYSQIIVLSLIIKNTWWKGGGEERLLMLARLNNVLKSSSSSSEEVKRVKEHSTPPIWKNIRLIHYLDPPVLKWVVNCGETILTRGGGVKG